MFAEEVVNDYPAVWLQDPVRLSGNPENVLSVASVHSETGNNDVEPPCRER
jgi:hypothetical protein